MKTKLFFHLISFSGMHIIRYEQILEAVWSSYHFGGYDRIEQLGQVCMLTESGGSMRPLLEL
jgi:hypothetical protein